MDAKIAILILAGALEKACRIRKFAMSKMHTTSLPDTLYFASDQLLDEIRGRTFLTPYMGIASNFIARHKDVPATLGYNVNFSYPSWAWDDSELSEPLNEVEIWHNIKGVEPETGIKSGYIYAIDASGIKDKLSLFEHTNDPNRELIYDSDQPLVIKKVIPHTVNWRASYNPLAHTDAGVATRRRLDQKLAALVYDPPYPLEKIPNYLHEDPVHHWRSTTGIELIHQEPTREELERIYQNFLVMPKSLQEISDQKSIELFGIDNSTHYRMLKLKGLIEDNSKSNLNK